MVTATGPPLTIGEVARQAGMRASRIRYYERAACFPLRSESPACAGTGPDVVRRLAIIDLAQRVGFTLDEIRQLLGPGTRPVHDRIRELAIDKLPEIEGLIARAMTIRKLLVTCAACECDSVDECSLFDDRVLASTSGLQKAKR